MAAADAPTALGLYLAQLDFYVPHRDTERGIPIADETIKLAQALDDRTALVKATLAKISLQDFINQTTEFESTHESLLALEAGDEFAIKLHRVRRKTSLEDDDDLREQRWLEGNQMAVDRQLPAIETEAWDALAWVAYYRDDLELAAPRLKSSATLGPWRSRDGQDWNRYIHLFEQLGETTHALATVQRKLAEAPDSQEPGFRAELHDGLALLLAAEGDFLPAYEALRQAADLKTSQDFAPQFLPMAKMTHGNISAVADSAGVDAAIRATQREAELALTKVHRQRLIIAIIAAILLILLLTFAYQLKRRAATAAALSREAAELRAKNADLLALRYQLNPHFLCSALDGLRSRFAENATAGLTLLDRLTEFCRVVFVPHSDGLQTLGEECALIESFLHIEKDRGEDNLQIELDCHPAAKAKTLPTMLIYPLVDNALKNGAEICTILADGNWADSSFLGLFRDSGTWNDALAISGALGLVTLNSSTVLSGILEMELGGTTRATAGVFGSGTSDALNITGALTPGGTLNIVSFESFDPTPGDTFQLFNASSIGGTFAAINFTSFDSGINWNTSSLTTLGSITVSAVPEPSTFALLASLSGLGLATTHRRRRPQ